VKQRINCGFRPSDPVGLNDHYRRVLVIPESRAERLLTPPKRLFAGERGSGASKVPGALALLTQPAVRARGGVFIRARPPSCAGDRALRMGTEMGESRRCFRMFLE
jgi:hypothetical protein